MILSSYGCKVSWTLRGGTGNAASAEASAVACKRYTHCKPGTDDADFPTVLCNHHRPLSERSPLHSLRQTTLNSADFIVGTGMRGVQDAEDGFVIMKTCGFCCVHTYGGTLVVSAPWYVRTQQITAEAVYIRSCHCLDSHKAPNPASGWIGHIVAVFQIVFTCMGNQSIAEAPGFQR